MFSIAGTWLGTSTGKSAETYIYVRKNLLLFQLEKTLLSQLLVFIYT